MVDRIKKTVKRGAEFIARGIASTGVSPTQITLVGFVLNALVALVLASGAMTVGGILVLVVGLFDTLDGALARVTQRTTVFGAFIDSTLDRYSEAAILLALVYVASVRGDHIVVLLGFTTVVGSIMVSYTRARAEGLGLRCEVGLLPRPERVVILGIGVIVGQVALALALLAILTNVTVIQRILHVRRLTMAQTPQQPEGRPALENAPPGRPSA